MLLFLFTPLFFFYFGRGPLDTAILYADVRFAWSFMTHKNHSSDKSAIKGLLNTIFF